MAIYYKLIDLDMVAKQEHNQAYIYDESTGKWREDTGNVLAARLMGIDGESDDACQQISENDAQMFIGRVDDGLQ